MKSVQNASGIFHMYDVAFMVAEFACIACVHCSLNQLTPDPPVPETSIHPSLEHTGTLISNNGASSRGGRRRNSSDTRSE